MADLNIDLDDLANAVLEELSYTSKFNKYEEEALKELRDELNKRFSKSGTALADNLADQMKMEFLIEIKDKYTETQLRQMEFEYRDRYNIN